MKKITCIVILVINIFILININLNVKGAGGGGGGRGLIIVVDGGIIDSQDFEFIEEFDGYSNVYYTFTAVGSVIDISFIPTKENYVFDGYYYDIDFKYKLDDDMDTIILNDNLVLYVKWLDHNDQMIHSISSSWFDLIKNLAIGFNTIFITIFSSNLLLSDFGSLFLIFTGILISISLICFLTSMIIRKFKND